MLFRSSIQLSLVSYGGVFQTGSSLWVSFMRTKYYRGVHPCQEELNSYASVTWRHMLNVSWQVELSMMWLVHVGLGSFWYDNWLGNGALFLKSSIVPNLSFRDFIANRKWDFHLLSQVFPMEITSSILLQLVLDNGRADEVIWLLTKFGKFSLSSAFHEVR